MYVITVSGGQYEDKWTNVDSVTDNFDKGQAYVNKMNGLSEQVRQAQQQLANFHNDYLQKNPQPPYNNQRLENTPNGSSGNKKVYEEANKAIHDWIIQFNTDKNQWLEKNYTEEMRAMIVKNEDLDWNIEPAKWLD